MVYLVIVPRILVKIVGISLHEIFVAIMKPLLCASIAGAGAWSTASVISINSVYTLLGITLLFGVAYAGSSWCITLNAQERKKITIGIKRKFKILNADDNPIALLEIQQEEFDDLIQ